MSNSADSPEGPVRRPIWRPVRLLTAGVFALAGLIFVTSFNTAKGTNLRTDDSLLKLSDLIGLDTVAAIADSMYAEYKEPLYAAPPILQRMVDAGRLGRKTGAGFYTY